MSIGHNYIEDNWVEIEEKLQYAYTRLAYLEKKLTKKKKSREPDNQFWWQVYYKNNLLMLKRNKTAWPTRNMALSTLASFVLPREYWRNFSREENADILKNLSGRVKIVKITEKPLSPKVPKSIYETDPFNLNKSKKLRI